jgi:hypothetical protein
MSAIVILAALIALAWFLNSNLLKLLTLAVFFAIPVMQNAVQPSFSLDFVLNTAKWWITELMNAVSQYVIQSISSKV